MAMSTNVEATAVNTIEWLSAPDTTIVVPVYQRQYRWDIGGCERLLADIRAVAAETDAHRHFLGSILSARDAAGDDLILIDGQQRITTVMLLVAALHHAIRDRDPALADQLSRVLVRADDPARTTLRPHHAWARRFESVVLDRRAEGEGPEGRGPEGAAEAEEESRFDDNYAFFRSQILPEEVPSIWRGLQKLEHVSITLGAAANAQQIFESLNSTGEPLRDHELIHNYILMGLSHAEQLDVEAEFWLPIERHTGEAIGAFWRHYLVMTTGREISAGTEHGVYAAFRQRFARMDRERLRRDAATWREHAEIYGILLQPASQPDSPLRRQLEFVTTFGRAPFPLIMGAFARTRRGDMTSNELIEVLEWVQSLYLRRAVIGLPTDRLVARLVRAFGAGREELRRAISRITPSDERVRAVLKYSELPHAAYVLTRLQQVTDSTGFDVDLIAPPAPGDAWSGDGVRPWSELSEDEQNSHRALSPTLGNLTLLETALAERTFGESFPDKAAHAYSRSAVAGTRELASLSTWGTAAIAQRTQRLSEEVLRIWRRPALPEIDDDGLTPVLDAVLRRGWPAGWDREFDYVEYRGEHWEVKDVRALFHRVFQRAWTDDRPAAVAYSTRRGGPIYTEMAWKGPWDRLDDDHFLYMGWESTYMMSAVQGVLEESGLAADVFVKYSYIGNVM